MLEFEDMSAYAVHFTTPDREPAPTTPLPLGWAGHFELARRMRMADRTGYFNMLSILGDQHIRPFVEPHGAGREVPGVEDRHRSAALSEIPLHQLGRLVKSRSVYGIGFRHEFLLKQGGARVWYLEDDAPASDALKTLVQARADDFDQDDPLWHLTPFVDYPRIGEPFEDWRWEREWRVPEGLSFTPDDVSFLFIPEELHGRAREFFESALAENIGPAYLCPYIDPSWKRERIADALR